LQSSLIKYQSIFLTKANNRVNGYAVKTLITTSLYLHETALILPSMCRE